MIKDKPYVIFLWITILSAILLASKVTIASINEDDNLYWILVFIEALPYLGGLSLLLTVVYWLLFKSKRPTHPHFNVVQLVTLVISYVSLSSTIGTAIRDSDSIMNSMEAPNDVAVMYFVFMASTVLTFIVLILNAIMSIAKPNFGRREVTNSDH